MRAVDLQQCPPWIDVIDIEIQLHVLPPRVIGEGRELGRVDLNPGPGTDSCRDQAEIKANLVGSHGGIARLYDI